MNIDALKEYKRLKDHCFFLTIDCNAVSNETLNTFILNVQPISYFCIFRYINKAGFYIPPYISTSSHFSN